MSQSRILVAGASGRLGQLVLDELLHAGVRDIIATTRTPEKLGAYAALGVDVRPGDFNDPETLKKAFQGADRLLLISTDDLFSGKRIQQHQNAIDAAKRAGVRHILYTLCQSRRRVSRFLSPLTMWRRKQRSTKAVWLTRFFVLLGTQRTRWNSASFRLLCEPESG